MGDKEERREEERREIVRLQEATNTSVIAFVLSIFMPLVGLILGIKAHKEIKNSEQTLTGRAFAVAAMWIGGIGTALWGALIALVILTSGGHHHHEQVRYRGFGFNRQGQQGQQFGGFGGMMGGNSSGSNSGNGFGGMMRDNGSSQPNVGGNGLNG